MPHQAALTVITEVKPDAVAALKALLDKNDAPSSNELIPFGRFHQLHFARFVVVDTVNDLEGKLIPPQLLFLSDIDEPRNAYLEQLSSEFGAGFDTIYQHCVGFPAGEVTPAVRLSYLKTHLVKVGAAYVNTIGRTLPQVRDETGLRDEIENFIDRSYADFQGASASKVRDAIQGFVRNEPSLSWALRRVPEPGRLKLLLPILPVALVGLLLLPLLMILVPVWLIIVRVHEWYDAADDERPHPAYARVLSEREDFYVQNQFSAIGFLKPGKFRHWTSRVILYLAGLAIPLQYGHGILAGVRTIHFARWVFLDDHRRLFFASNYDGSLESYMDDFIDKVAWGLNAVFSNGRGYPKTRWLVFKGAKDELAFKHYIRRHQITSQIWYSAYPQLSNLNIANNAAIRAGLAGEMSEEDAAAWLRRL